ncbi:MAG: hypothetical protein IKJ67_04865 [Bacteroidales bacterium]|nr:hypothetical protein [Bacteroidales bacterium]
MKKVVLTLGVVAFVAAMTSCSKTCSCKTYALGVAGAAEEVELAEGFDNCEAMTAVVDDPMFGKTGMECE